MDGMDGKLHEKRPRRLLLYVMWVGWTIWLSFWLHYKIFERNPNLPLATQNRSLVGIQNNLDMSLCFFMEKIHNLTKQKFKEWKKNDLWYLVIVPLVDPSLKVASHY
jgi:hypothetical protein